MAWSRDSAARLLVNEDFMDLFGDPESPVATEIERLTRNALTPSVASDPARIVRTVSIRAGLTAVLDIVRKTAESAAPEAEVIDVRTRRWAGSKYLPRPVGG